VQGCARIGEVGDRDLDPKPVTGLEYLTRRNQVDEWSVTAPGTVATRTMPSMTLMARPSGQTSTNFAVQSVLLAFTYCS
jgi:hypothetical protein